MVHGPFLDLVKLSLNQFVNDSGPTGIPVIAWFDWCCTKPGSGSTVVAMICARCHWILQLD